MQSTLLRSSMIRLSEQTRLNYKINTHTQDIFCAPFQNDQMNKVHKRSNSPRR